MCVSPLLSFYAWTYENCCSSKPLGLFPFRERRVGSLQQARASRIYSFYQRNNSFATLLSQETYASTHGPNCIAWSLRPARKPRESSLFCWHIINLQKTKHNNPTRLLLVCKDRKESKYWRPWQHSHESAPQHGCEG